MGDQTANAGDHQITDETATAFVTELVKHQSLSGNEKNAVDFMVRRLEQFGYQRSYADSAGSAIGIRNADAAKGTLVLLGHIDTVPGEIPIRIEDGKLFGRGSVDAKGPLAAFVIAGATCPLPSSVRLVVAGAVEEESASSRGARQIAQDFQADMCVIGEPSSASAITLGYKGRVLMEYSVQLDEGHTAGPMPSAAESAAEFWNVVRAHAEGFNQSRSLMFDQLQPSLRRFNTQSNGLVDEATMVIGCRLPPDFDVEAYKAQLRQHLGERAELRFYGHELAHRSPRNSPIVAAFSSAIRIEFGRAAGFKLKTGTADMNVVSPIWQCPILAYGPGDSSLDHTPHEHLEIAEYLQGIRVLRNAIEAIASRMA